MHTRRYVRIALRKIGTSIKSIKNEAKKAVSKAILNKFVEVLKKLKNPSGMLRLVKELKIDRKR